MFKQSIAAISGTILQWYDYSLFGYLAPIMAVLYFPNNNPVTSLLYTFSIFAISFILAPFGAALFGYIGDNFGRKKALSISIVAMAVPTTLMAILPGYQQIGLMAAILLTLFRMVQALVASAEYAGSAIFLIEHAKPGRKFFYGALTSSAYSVGSTLAGFMASLMTASFLPAWAWRIAFAVALIGGLLIFYMRKNTTETAEFVLAKQSAIRKTTFLTALKNHPKAVLCTVLAGLFTGVITFGTYVYGTTYLNIYAKLPLSTAIGITTIALMVDACLEPLVALLADKWGGKWLSLCGILGIIVFVYPVFHLLSSGSVYRALLGMIALSSLIALAYAPMNVLLVSLFPTECRYSGFAVSFNISIALSGMIPLLMTWFIYYSQNLFAPAFFYIIGGILGFIALQLAMPYSTRALSRQAAYSS